MRKSSHTEITIKDIAALSGCSISAVSKVLNGTNGNTRVSEENRKLIQTIALRENYHPNFNSQSLRRKNCKTLGIYVSPEIWSGMGNPYELSLLRGIEQIACNKYDLLVLNMGSNRAAEICLEKLSQNRIEGVLLMHLNGISSWLYRLTEATSNVVSIDSCNYRRIVDCICYDHREAVFTAIRHLRDLGHKRIGFIGHGIPNCDDSTIIREKAFHDAKNMTEFKGLELISWSSEELSRNAPFCQMEGRLGLNYFLSLKKRPTAIIAYNGLCGLSAQFDACGQGLKIPQDISLMSIGSTPFSEGLIFGLTAVQHPYTEIGALGAQLLIAKIEKEDTSPIPRLVQGQIVDNGSTAPPADPE